MIVGLRASTISLLQKAEHAIATQPAGGSRQQYDNISTGMGTGMMIGQAGLTWAANVGQRQDVIMKKM